MLPSRKDLMTLVVVLLGIAALLHARGRIAELEATLAARPAIHDSAKVEKAKSRKLGASKTTTTTKTNPDGTKEKTTVREVASEESNSSEIKATEHSEVPVCPPARRNKTRYGHMTLDPLDSMKPRGLDAGLTLWDTWDAGVSGDWKYKAVGVQIGGRF